MGKLTNKHILITGGTSGIGEAFARLFAREGGYVVIVGRNSEAGLRISSEINSESGKKCCTFLPCDVSSENNVINLKKEYSKKFNKLDVLVNNAGVLISSAVDEIRADDWHKTYSVNTDAVMYMTKHFIDLIIVSHGNILNNASIDGMQCNIRGQKNYMYASSKAATIQFSQMCALNYSSQIRVNCLCPGVTETPFFINRDFSRFLDAIPMGRVGQPEEIAKAALFLISDDASYVSGAVLAVDGGAAIW